MTVTRHGSDEEAQSGLDAAALSVGTVSALTFENDAVDGVSNGLAIFP